MIEFKNCSGCGKQPDVIKQRGDYLLIKCTSCGISVSDGAEPTIAIGYWNLINMSPEELLLYAANKVNKEIKWERELRRIVQEATGFKRGLDKQEHGRKYEN